MLRKIKLYGELAKFLGQQTFEAEVNNAAQAIRFLVVNFPKLESHMADRYYKIIVDNDWTLTDKELHYPTGQNDIKIVPVVAGAGGGAGRQILIGAAIIGVSFLFPWCWFVWYLWSWRKGCCNWRFSYKSGNNNICYWCCNGFEWSIYFTYTC